MNSANRNSLLAIAGTMIVLDLFFLGVLARPFYQDALGPLLRDPPLAGPAAAFYALYVLAIWALAVRPAASLRDAFARGALLGAIAYGTYELTNYTMIAGWPARLVPVDWAWGIFLTGTSAAAGALAKARN